MYRVIVFTLGVLLASVSGWGACGVNYTSESNIVNCVFYGTTSCSNAMTFENPCTSPCGQDVSTSSTNGTLFCTARNFSRTWYCNSNGNVAGRLNYYACDTQSEVDSVNCVNNGHQWDSVADSCKVCNERDTTWRESSCAYDIRKGMYLNIVTQYRRVDCEIKSIEREYYSQKCDTLPNDSSITCMGSVDGVHVYLRGASGRVTKCAADGSCDFALQKVALGQCPNPNDPPQDGDSGDDDPNSSSSEPPPESSSQQDENSSDSQMGGDYGEIIDTLHAMHVTMEDSLGAIHGTLENFSPFISGTYDGVINLNSVAHDINQNTRFQLDFLSDIKDNTGNTANNTGNINSKLNTTNELLNDIKNKNWNPTINVNPEVNVAVDTSKAPSEILQLMKDGQPNQSDTAGFGAQIDGMMGKIDSLVGVGIPFMNGDSISNAMRSLKNNGLGAIKDTIDKSAIMDSMTTWELKITDNRYITGQGSDNCPEILTRTWQVRFPIGRGGADISIGPLGVYLCKPVAGMGITFWALCRVILRAMVAIACMIWLYKSVLGIDGGSSEED